MVDEDRALMGFGTCGLLAVVDIRSREVVGEYNLGDQYFTNDIIKLRLQGKHSMFALASNFGLLTF